MGHTREEGHAKEPQLIDRHGNGAAQKHGAGAAPPVFLPEQTAKHGGHGNEGHTVGSGGGAGKIIDGGGQQRKNASGLRALQQAHQQNGGHTQVCGGAEELDAAHDAVLDDQA